MNGCRGDCFSDTFRRRLRIIGCMLQKTQYSIHTGNFPTSQRMSHSSYQYSKMCQMFIWSYASAVLIWTNQVWDQELTISILNHEINRTISFLKITLFFILSLSFAVVMSVTVTCSHITLIPLYVMYYSPRQWLPIPLEDYQDKMSYPVPNTHTNTHKQSPGCPDAFPLRRIQRWDAGTQSDR